MAGPLKSGCWGLALAAITWILAAEAFGAAAEQLAVTSLPEGMAVYVRHGGARGCHADMDLRIELDPDSTISVGQVHRVVPQIGAAAVAQCPVAVAARMDVVRRDQPNLVIQKLTALKVRDWVAELRRPESPVVQLYPARVDWEAKCADRISLLDKALREPSTAPGWLRGAWNQAGEWVASSSQWIGETAAALSSGQWPGEFRARVADFEAAGASLCVLAQQELNHAGAALGSGRLDDAARYIAQASDLFPRVEAADQAANAYYLGAVDRADTHWEIVFTTSKIAFSVTLAVGTAGAGTAVVSPSAAGYYALKYGLFNAMEFAVDSTEMSLKDAAAKRAQLLAVELLVDGLIGQLLPNDFSYERLVAQGELAKADWLLANVSADLAQQISGGLHPELLRQVAEAAHVQATDAAVRAAIEREILKHGAYFLASALEEGKETIRGIASNFGPEYLAKRGTPPSESETVICRNRFGFPAFEYSGREAAAVLYPGDSCKGFSVGFDGVVNYGQHSLGKLFVSMPHDTNIALLTSAPTPLRRFVYAVIWDGESGGGQEGFIIDTTNDAIIARHIVTRTTTFGLSAIKPVSSVIRWSPNESFAVVPAVGEVQDVISVIHLGTGHTQPLYLKGFERDLCDWQAIDMLPTKWISETRVRFGLELQPNPWAETMPEYRPGMCDDGREYPYFFVTVDLGMMTVVSAMAGENEATLIRKEPKLNQGALLPPDARGSTNWHVDALTPMLLHPNEIYGGITFSPNGVISVSSTILFQERLFGHSNFDYFYLRIYEAGEGFRIVELFEVAEDLSVHLDDPLLAIALISPRGDILYEGSFPDCDSKVLRLKEGDAGCGLILNWTVDDRLLINGVTVLGSAEQLAYMRTTNQIGAGSPFLMVYPTSPGGRYRFMLVAYWWEDTVAAVLWDSSAGKLMPADMCKYPPNSLEWSPDGRYAVVHCKYDGRDNIWVFDASNGKRSRLFGWGDYFAWFDELVWEGAARFRMPIQLCTGSLIDVYSGDPLAPCWASALKERVPVWEVSIDPITSSVSAVKFGARCLVGSDGSCK